MNLDASSPFCQNLTELAKSENQRPCPMFKTINPKGMPKQGKLKKNVRVIMCKRQREREGEKGNKKELVKS